MKMSKFIGLLCLVVVGGVVSSSALGIDQVQIPFRAVPNDVQYVPDEFIVVLKAGVPTFDATNYTRLAKTGISDLDVLAGRYGVEHMVPQFVGAAQRGITALARHYKVKFSGPTDLQAVMQAYAADPAVDHVEPIGIHPVYATPNDGYFPNQWHLNRADDHDIDAPEAWNIETGDPSIITAILDTGVRYYHKDLGGVNASSTNPGAARGNMWINTAELNGTAGVDDDGNGYVDDWIGYDFVNGATPCWSGEDCNTKDNDPRDFNGHGTHCAGNLSAINNNGYATCASAGGWLAGTNQEYGNGVKVMACRVGWSGSYLGYEVGYVRMDFCAEAFYYAANKGAKIASCSWGSSNSGGIDAAITYFVNHGGLIFKAAGNDGTQTADYMCARTDVISVAATDTLDRKADFSTYGTWVDISAPGTGIMSSYHSHANPASDYVATMDGTSMATPLAGSVAALIWSKNLGWTASQVQQQLFSSADNIDAQNPSYVGKLGAGRINAFNAVNTGAPPPVAQFTGSPTSGCAPLTVSFTDQSTGQITSWSWTLGDGGTSIMQNPSYQYTTAGIYTVSLTVTGPTGSNTNTKTNYITVSTVPVANFSGTPTSGAAPLTVSFTDQSTGVPTSWSWNFGDAGTSTSQNPSHQYLNAGAYTVTLTASNVCGSDPETKTNYITVATPVQYCDDFADGNISNWGNKTGTWTATGGYMKGNSNTTDARTTSPFGSFTGVKIEADVRMNTGRNERKARIIFAYQNASNYRFIEADDVNNYWRWYDRVSGSNSLKKTVSSTISTATWYHAIVNAATDGTVTLTVGTTSLGSYKYTSAVNGQVGCGFNRSNSDFDNFCVQSLGAAAAPQFVGGDNSVTSTAPKRFDLSQNYPNPFNASTDIQFTLSEGTQVKLEVFDILGHRVRTLVDEFRPAGLHIVHFDARTDDGRPLTSGMYFYRLRTESMVETRKMVLMK